MPAGPPSRLPSAAAPIGAHNNPVPYTPAAAHPDTSAAPRHLALPLLPHTPPVPAPRLLPPSPPPPPAGHPHIPATLLPPLPPRSGNPESSPPHPPPPHTRSLHP